MVRRNPAPDPRFQPETASASLAAYEFKPGALALFLGRSYYGCMATILPDASAGLTKTVGGAGVRLQLAAARGASLSGPQGCQQRLPLAGGMPFEGGVWPHRARQCLRPGTAPRRASSWLRAVASRGGAATSASCWSRAPPTAPPFPSLVSAASRAGRRAAVVGAVESSGGGNRGEQRWWGPWRAAVVGQVGIPRAGVVGSLGR